MELRDLRYFCTTAELEHVTRASEKLNIAQPYLTRVIHQIEEEVGGELFEKNGRRIRLNSNGELFYKYAKKVLADMELLYEEIGYIFDRKEQTITLLSNTEAFSTRMIQAFKKENPHYALTVLHANYQEMADALVSGEAQFAISCPPIRMDDNLELIETIDAFNIRGCVLLPPGHPLIKKGFVSVDDLRNEKLVTMPRGSAMRNRLQPFFDQYNYRPDIVVESNNLNMITQAVQGGLGYAFLTEVIMADYPELRDQVVTVDTLDDVGYYGFSYNRLTVNSRNAAHFKNFILSFFNELKANIADAHVLD